jgi:hypothetical protein
LTAKTITMPIAPFILLEIPAWSLKYLVVGLRYGLEPFLTGGIPDLHTNTFSIDLDGLDLEIDACIETVLPMVVRWLLMKLFSQKRSKMFVLPTPLSPIISSFARWS